MSFRDLIPWHGDRKSPQERMGEDPFYGLQREINNLFDRFDWFPTRFGENEERFGSFTPKINIKENKKNIEVSAELPGMDENDIDVTLSDNTLTIKGEKKSEV
jgi:HSP20 family protein